MKPRIAFYAPLKPIDHPIASGDREIARLMVKALSEAGFAVEIASRAISYQKRPSQELFHQRKQDAERALAALRADWLARDAEDRPVLWFTYHPYCKSPDWLGPSIAPEFGIPYVTAEACRTRQDTDAEWDLGRRQVQGAVRMASANFCLKQSDMDYLTSFLPDRSSIIPLAPFVDVARLDSLTAELPDSAFPIPAPLIVAAGMMRPGFKTESYLALAAALSKIADKAWNLVLIGDGPTSSQIRQAFSSLEDSRLHWTGSQSQAEVLSWFRRADILAWPGLREAIGMVFLEAQSQRTPVVAFNSLGVPSVVNITETGLLVTEGDTDAYADALVRLLADGNLRDKMGTNARAYIMTKHDISAAATVFSRTLDPLIS